MAHYGEDLAGSRPQIVEELSAELERFSAAERDAPAAQEISKEVRQRLEQLGYAE